MCPFLGYILAYLHLFFGNLFFPHEFLTLNFRGFVEAKFLFVLPKFITVFP